MLLSFRITPNNKGVCEPLTETIVDPRKTFSGGNGYELCYMKPSRRKPRPDLERENPGVAVWLVAEMVLENAEQIACAPIPREYIEKLIVRARDAYGNRDNKRFRDKMHGKYACEYLHMFMQHWLHAHLQHDQWPLVDKLPREFYWPKECWYDHLARQRALSKPPASPHPATRPSRKKHPKRARAAAL